MTALRKPIDFLSAQNLFVTVNAGIIPGLLREHQDIREKPSVVIYRPYQTGIHSEDAVSFDFVFFRRIF